MSRQPLVVVGIGHDGPSGLSPEARAHVESARILAGGRRHLDFFNSRPGEKVVFDGSVAAFIETIRKKYLHDRTVVLASGDPLFYGIGRALLDVIPKDDLVFLPHLSSVQLAFSRVKETWHDARIISLHGREADALAVAIAAREPKLAVLTDAENHPAAIAELLRRHGAAEEYAIWVCENLGGPDERISRHAAANLRSEAFSPLNIVILLRTADEPATVVSGLPLLGIPEDALLHQSGPHGMITQREVRLLVLCYLALQPDDVLWDVGAGSGSVSLEAARLSTRLKIYAVERDPAAFARLESNVARLGLGRVHTLLAEAPDGLVDLPDPNAVFIGGSRGRLAEILGMVVERLQPGGRIVLNCITLENLFRSWEKLRQLQFEPEATSLQIAHSRPLGHLHCLEPEKPLFILRARKL